MGRAKLTTFHNRKKGLKKKAYELSTLCGVDTCMIIFGPKEGEFSSTKPEIWPENHEEVRRILTRFKDHSKEKREKPSIGLPESFENQKKKIEDELSKRQGQNDIEYPTWDERMERFSQQELKKLISLLDFKRETITARIELAKRKLENSIPADQSTCERMQPRPLSCWPNCPYDTLLPEPKPQPQPQPNYPYDGAMNPGDFDCSSFSSGNCGSSVVSMDMMGSGPMGPLYYDPSLTTHDLMEPVSCYMEMLLPLGSSWQMHQYGSSDF